MSRYVSAAALAAVVCSFVDVDVFNAAAIDRVPVTATFRCNAVPSVLTENPCGQGDRLAGDGGVYRGIPLGPKTAPEGAYLTNGGQFWLVSQPGSGRAVFFDFSQPVLAPTAPVLRTFTTTWSSALQPNWTVTPTGFTSGLWSMRVADGVRAAIFKANFRRAADSYLWTVRFSAANYPGSTDARVACTSETAGGACNGWRIEATLGETALLEAGTPSGKTVRYVQGTYRMPFAIDVTYP